MRFKKFLIILKKFLIGFLFSLGFLLSPFSPWNDIFINIPLAYVFAIPFGRISKDVFLPAFMFMYIMTNVIGIILMRRTASFLLKKEKKKYTKKQIKVDIAIMVVFTILIFILVKIGLIPVPSP